MDGETAFPFTVPVRDRAGQMTGALSVVYSLRAYATFFEQLQLPEETILGITDHNGVRIFFRPLKDTNPIGEPIRGEAWAKFVSGEDTTAIDKMAASLQARRAEQEREQQRIAQSLQLIHVLAQQLGAELTIRSTGAEPPVTEVIGEKCGRVL